MSKTYSCAGCGRDVDSDDGPQKHPEHGWMCDTCASCAAMIEGDVVARLVELLERSLPCVMYYDEHEGAPVTLHDVRRELVARGVLGTRPYMVVGVNANNDSDRYADTYEGVTPADAEQAAREHYRAMNGDELIVAAVIDTETHQLVG